MDSKPNLHRIKRYVLSILGIFSIVFLMIGCPDPDIEIEFQRGSKRVEVLNSRILVIPNGGIGDFLQLSPVFLLGREYDPTLKIDCAIYAGNLHKEIIWNNPFISEMVELNIQRESKKPLWWIISSLLRNYRILRRYDRIFVAFARERLKFETFWPLKQLDRRVYCCPASITLPGQHARESMFQRYQYEFARSPSRMG